MTLTQTKPVPSSLGHVTLRLEFDLWPSHPDSAENAQGFTPLTPITLSTNAAAEVQSSQDASIGYCIQCMTRMIVSISNGLSFIRVFQYMYIYLYTYFIFKYEYVHMCLEECGRIARIVSLPMPSFFFIEMSLVVKCSLVWQESSRRYILGQQKMSRTITWSENSI